MTFETRMKVKKETKESTVWCAPYVVSTDAFGAGMRHIPHWLKLPVNHRVRHLSILVELQITEVAV